MALNTLVFYPSRDKDVKRLPVRVKYVYCEGLTIALDTRASLTNQTCPGSKNMGYFLSFRQAAYISFHAFRPGVL